MSRAIRADRAQMWFLPPSVDEWVGPKHPARFVAALIETLDLRALGFRQSPDGDEGRPHFAPELLLGVWLFGWMERMRSSRALEKACQRDIAFLWLTGNKRIDHVTLWRFFDDNQAALKQLFKRVVCAAAEAGLVGFALHALDGTKMRVASSMDTALHRKQLEELLKKVDAIVETTVQETKDAEQGAEPDWQMPDQLATSSALRKRLRQALDRLDARATSPNAELTSEQSPSDSAPAKAESTPEPPTSPEPAPPQADVVQEPPPSSVSKLDQLKNELRAAVDHLDRCDTNHLHPNEPDARVMKTREGARLAYNAQAVVDHDSDLIVAAGICGDETDHRQLVPMVEAVRDTLGKTAEQTVADAGYASGGQFREAQRRHLPVLVNVQEESAKGEFAKSKFTYDAERNAYTCPRGEVLPFELTAKPTTGKPQARQVYRCHNGECPVRAQCTKDKKGRTIKRLDTEDDFAHQLARQSSPAMQILLSLRGEIVEHIFGIAKTIDNFRRFTVRGISGAGAQWALVCLAINLRKLVPAWEQDRWKLGAVG